VTSSIGHMGTASSAANDSLSDDSVHKMLHRPAYLRFTRKFTSKNCCVNSRGRIQRIPVDPSGPVRIDLQTSSGIINVFDSENHKFGGECFGGGGRGGANRRGG
jgi:hypothetical protein